MAFTAQQVQEITSMMEIYLQQMRPPEHIRPQLDLDWRIERQSVFLFEIRPRWDNPSIIANYDFAKATWVQTEKEWHILEERFLIEIGKDPYGCFRG